jgi:sortase A
MIDRDDEHTLARRRFRVLPNRKPLDRPGDPPRAMRYIFVPPRAASRRRVRILLQGAQYAFVLVGLACLGTVAFKFGRARIFQSYQSWRLNRAVRHMDGQIKDSSRNDYGVPVPTTLPPGALVGRLEIPKLDISVIVLEGVGTDILERAAGHVPDTAFPGGPGNIVIAGHRDTFFRALRNITKDDEITLTTPQGIYRYHVQSTEKVGPENVKVLEATAHPTLTLVTCFPFYYIGPAPERFIVRADEIPNSLNPPAVQISDITSPTVESGSAESAYVMPVKSPIRHKKSRYKPHHPARAHRTQVAKAAITDTQTSDAVAPPTEQAPPQEAVVSTPVGPPKVEAPNRAIDSKSSAPVADAHKTNPPVNSPSPPHKALSKVRAWFTYIPRRLAQ